MENRIDRRNLLKAGAAFSVIGGTQFFTAIPALADFAAGPTVRRNASTMGANDPILRGYRRAIQAMRALPNNNPCSWFYQAAIHGTHDLSNLPSWNTCHLQANFFWAWHRMYLYFFERIVRKYSGMYDWAIPYWDWTNPAQLSLPAPFRQSSSLLFDASRNPAVNNGAALSSTLATQVNGAMGLTTYMGAQSSINGPHGSVHIAVGGKMLDVKAAAQDPIFWVHHSQVDRLWNLWLALGGGRSSPIGDAAWRNTAYTFFDECCQPVTLKGCDVLRAAAQLSYAYEGEPPQVNQYCPPVWVWEVLDISIISQMRVGLVLGPRPVRAPLLPRGDREAGRRLAEAVRTGERSIALQLRDVVADRQPGVSWEVHVGPRGFAPGPRSLVGIFALFGSGLREGSNHFHPAEFMFNATRALRGQDPARLEIAFVPVSGLEKGQATAAEAVRPLVPVRIGEIALILDQPMPEAPRDEQEKLRREEESR